MIILDGKLMDNIENAHLHIKENLEFPDYYGMNLDALWDMISTWGYPVHIRLVNEKYLIENLGNYGYELVGVFIEAMIENENVFFDGYSPLDA